MSTAEFAGGPLPKPVDEARRILALADCRELPIRVLGGVAIALSAPANASLLWPRIYQDIDLIIPNGRQQGLSDLMAAAGYLADEEFNAFNSHRRMLFHDEVHGRQVDIFVEVFAMCHAIPLGSRLLHARSTIPLPELLLTKLQVVELNEKDLRDVLNLVHLHDPDENHSPEGLSARRVAGYCASDWGLWRTVSLNIERAQAALAELSLGADDRALVHSRLDALATAIDSEPKSRKWKLRARVGDRVRWYEDVEEVA